MKGLATPTVTTTSPIPGSDSVLGRRRRDDETPEDTSGNPSLLYAFHDNLISQSLGSDTSGVNPFVPGSPMPDLNASEASFGSVTTPPRHPTTHGELAHMLKKQKMLSTESEAAADEFLTVSSGLSYTTHLDH
jgi:hypothetical protein